MKLTILGCGTSTGVPLIGCTCQTCLSSSLKNKRTRASLYIQDPNTTLSLLIDASTDFRWQCLRENISKIDLILITHPHADHVGGLDDIRNFNFIQKMAIPLYGNTWTIESIQNRFPYMIEEYQAQYSYGGGLPQIKPQTISNPNRSFSFKNLEITPIPVEHGTQECLGFRIGKFAYITDCSKIPPDSIKLLYNLDFLILDCVRIKPHPTHLNWDEAQEVVKILTPKKTYFTHLGHDFEYEQWNKKLPSHIELAYDGLTFNFDEI